MEEQIKVLNVTATPVTPVASASADPELQKTVQATAQAVQESLNSFSDEIPSDEETKKAKSFLKNFTDYIKGEQFKTDINSTARKYNVPPKKLAENFFEKALGTVGDVLGIVIGTVCDVGHTLVDVLATVVHGGVNLICKVANALARVVTLNKTAIA